MVEKRATQILCFGGGEVVGGKNWINGKFKTKMTKFEKRYNSRHWTVLTEMVGTLMFF